MAGKYGNNEWKIRLLILFSIIFSIVVVSGIFVGAYLVIKPKYMAYQEIKAEKEEAERISQELEKEEQKRVEEEKKLLEEVEKNTEIVSSDEEIEQEVFPPQFSIIDVNSADLNNYYRAYVTSADATSQIRQSGVDNSPIKAFDGDEVSNWEEGVNGVGIGENLAGYFDHEYKVKYIVFKLGNWRQRGLDGTTKDYYNMNCRPKTLTITLGDLSQQITFSDEKKEHCVCLSYPYPASTINLRIDDVYRGGSYEDTVISDIAIYGE